MDGFIGLVERFNRTLTTMLAKTAKKGGRDWDRHAYILCPICLSFQNPQYSYCTDAILDYQLKWP